ncbi:hypothetical protein GCM10027169_16830 [Gordonia jinhuaensis]|uniref:Uncharacterized protein n=1 Tax=Gordonia jinhuaensis TaxID=1517702 RepID=A0A916X0B3_9ACTN|nr:hypothetical protein [Gordonia jinhuaensis]GGB47895.1 hypothetical protein GCM10011489_38860 [Gordonia jinhuaensis]
MLGSLITLMILFGISGLVVWALVKASTNNSNSTTSTTVWTPQQTYQPEPEQRVYGAPTHMRPPSPGFGQSDAERAAAQRKAERAQQRKAFAASVAVGAWELNKQRKQVRHERDRRWHQRERARQAAREREDARTIQKAQIDYINHLKRTGQYKKGGWWQG